MLQADRRKDERLYDELIAKAKAERKSAKEIDELVWEFLNEDNIHQHMIGKEQTRRLIAEAERLMVPLPDLNDPATWNEDRQWGDFSREAMADLRSRIRKERQEASQHFFSWISALTGLGGVIVAIIALLIGDGL